MAKMCARERVLKTLAGDNLNPTLAKVSRLYANHHMFDYGPPYIADLITVEMK